MNRIRIQGRIPPGIRYSMVVMVALLLLTACSTETPKLLFPLTLREPIGCPTEETEISPLVDVYPLHLGQHIAVEEKHVWATQSKPVRAQQCVGQPFLFLRQGRPEDLFLVTPARSALREGFEHVEIDTETPAGSWRTFSLSDADGINYYIQRLQDGECVETYSLYRVLEHEVPADPPEMFDNVLCGKVSEQIRLGF